MPFKRLLIFGEKCPFELNMFIKDFLNSAAFLKINSICDIFWNLEMPFEQLFLGKRFRLNILQRITVSTNMIGFTFLRDRGK